MVLKEVDQDMAMEADRGGGDETGSAKKCDQGEVRKVVGWDRMSLCDQSELKMS